MASNIPLFRPYELDQSSSYQFQPPQPYPPQPYNPPSQQHHNQWNNTGNSGQQRRLYPPSSYTTYPPRPGSVSSNVSHGWSLAPQSPRSLASSPALSTLTSDASHQCECEWSIAPQSPRSLASSPALSTITSSNISHTCECEWSIAPQSPRSLASSPALSAITSNVSNVDECEWSIAPQSPRSLASSPGILEDDTCRLGLDNEKLLKCFCQNCENELAGHPPVLDEKNRRLHMCNYAMCGMLFRRPGNLAIHLKRHKYEKKEDPNLGQKHSRLLRCFCRNCENELAGQPPVMDRKGSKLHVCNYPDCEMIFDRPIHLDTHRRRHIGEKKFSCTVCGLKFLRADYVVRHSRSVHRPRIKKVRTPPAKRVKPEAAERSSAEHENKIVVAKVDSNFATFINL